MRPASYLLALLAWPAFAQTVTARADVRVDGKLEHVRKINGRWWSDNNRQMFPPKEKGGLLWWIEKESTGAKVFNHHRPVDLARAESLHLFMAPDAVRQLLGDPNQAVFKQEGEPLFYHYYAAEGTEVFVWFMQNGLLGEAKYRRLDGGTLGGDMVGSVAQDLGGRSIFKILAEQAAQSTAEHRQLRPGSKASSARVSMLMPIETPPPPARFIIPEAWAKVTIGMTRADIVEKLGEPLSVMKIAGSDPEVEVLRYALESEGDATVRLEAGKVMRLTPR